MIDIIYHRSSRHDSRSARSGALQHTGTAIAASPSHGQWQPPQNSYHTQNYQQSLRGQTIHLHPSAAPQTHSSHYPQPLPQTVHDSWQQVSGVPVVACSASNTRRPDEFPNSTAASGQNIAKSSRSSGSSMKVDVERISKRIASHTQQRRLIQDNFVVAATKTAGPAVVRIDIERTVTMQPSGFGGADLFGLFFGDFGGGSGQRSKDEVIRAHGSGFCIDPSGIILTNAHVVAEADRVYASFPGKDKLRVSVLGTDEMLDVAVLAVVNDSSSVGGRAQFPFATLGTSAQLRVGDWAVCLGSPLGLNNTTTVGVVSNLERTSGESGWDWMGQQVIQTDAAVNQGNSGGPLTDERGAVVGVINSRVMGAEAIGFAIPIDRVGAVLPALLAGRAVPHACCGLRLRTLTRHLCQRRNADRGLRHAVPAVEGVLVEGVVPQSPADQADLRQGDVLVAFGGAACASREQVQRRTGRGRPGDRVKVVLKRAAEGGGVETRTCVIALIDLKTMKAHLRAQASAVPVRSIIVVK